MIINVSIGDRALKPIRLSAYNGRIFISLVDVVNNSTIKEINVLNDDDNMKLISIIGEDNFAMLYTENISIPAPYISRGGLKKLIDYPELDEYLIKMDLSKIDEFITKNKKRIIEILYSEEYKLNIKKNTSEKVVINNVAYNEKMNKINYHIKEAKKHMDLVLKLQEELIKGDY